MKLLFAILLSAVALTGLESQAQDPANPFPVPGTVPVPGREWDCGDFEAPSDLPECFRSTLAIEQAMGDYSILITGTGPTREAVAVARDTVQRLVDSGGRIRTAEFVSGMNTDPNAPVPEPILLGSADADEGVPASEPAPFAPWAWDAALGKFQPAGR